MAANSQAVLNRLLVDQEFAGKSMQVQAWMREFINMYKKERFTLEEFKHHLRAFAGPTTEAEVIVDDRGPKLNSNAEMNHQHLLTSEAGLERLENKRQDFPTNGVLKLYRGMSLHRVRALLGINREVKEGDEFELNDLQSADWSQLGMHLGDYIQAYYYVTKQESAREEPIARVLLEFWVQVEELFTPERLALPNEKRLQGLPLVLERRHAQFLKDEGLPSEIHGYKKEANVHEGTHPTLLGIKRESKGPWSLGVSRGAKDTFGQIG